MRVIQVPVLDDNYSYLLIDDESRKAAAVDPAEPSKVLSAAAEAGVDIVMVLTTHHHWDHSQGNEEMASKIKSLRVYGGDDRIPALNNTVGEGTSIEFGSIAITVRKVPCHTTGHVIYYAKDDNSSHAPVLFTGDTLFVGGCGKFFEGNGAQMYDALYHKIKTFPSDTEIHCGHEYTVSNLQFAASLTPENNAVRDKLTWAKERRAKSLTTVPSTIAEELTYNPFMRVESDEIKNALGIPLTTEPEEVMSLLRKRKNNPKM